MKSKILNICFVISFLSFAGCASKKEVIAFDNGSNLGQKKGLQIEKDSSLDGAVKNDFIDTEVVGKNIIEESTKKTNDGESKFVNELYNTTTSQVNGEDVVLKSIHFDLDMFTLTEENLALSLENSKKINAISLKGNNFKIKLEGNCDEWGNDEYNFALGLKRAGAVKSDLVKKGISSEQIVIVSYGESNPICKEQTAECWTKNRRVDHHLLQQ